MSIALLLLPDFALILLGLVIARGTAWPREFWSGLEKLVYYVLFPSLLFYSIAKNRVDVSAAAPALQLAAITVVLGMLAAWLGRWIVKTDQLSFASAFQTAFRFNSYIGLAVAGRLHGEAGIAAFGIVIGLVVPMCNIASVWALARHGELSVSRELVQNPLILATVGGVLYSLSGLPFPDVAQHFIARLGAASITCGLLCVGAALTLDHVGRHAPLMGYLTTVKLLLMPLVAWLGAGPLGVTGIHRDMVILLAALPTATSAYVLAVRMGGNGPLVAQCVTVSTLCGMIALPVWLNVAR
jgi:hypothetical protein